MLKLRRDVSFPEKLQLEEPVEFLPPYESKINAEAFVTSQFTHGAKCWTVRLAQVQVETRWACQISIQTFKCVKEEDAPPAHEREQITEWIAFMGNRKDGALCVTIESLLSPRQNEELTRSVLPNSQSGTRLTRVSEKPSRAPTVVVSVGRLLRTAIRAQGRRAAGPRHVPFLYHSPVVKDVSA
ncbi:hypothetical protein F2P81_016659 [Scophthalmus maximus]|uniref:Uncharacterized protein n=1 Tax=Scophthalmus maximus TaxID=52904 RepID=A0A6A4SM01_SCOMX|nr:hypothetical protein F2P81_016659 [Scophthalmus maximus]